MSDNHNFILLDDLTHIVSVPFQLECHNLPGWVAASGV
jgi:hypothetical protein